MIIMAKNRLLFISHDARRAGAPLLSLQILAWLKANTRVQIKIVLLTGGELEDDFRKIADVLILDDQGTKHLAVRALKVMIEHILPGFSQRRKVSVFDRFVNRFIPDWIYANTALSLAFLYHFKSVQKYLVLCHLHEMEYVINSTIGFEKFRRCLPIASQFICVAEVLKKDLMLRYVIDDSKISVIREPIKIQEHKRSRDVARKELNIPADAFVVVSCGIGGWRKGTDLFIQTAGLVLKEDPQVFFLWVGEIDHKSMLMYRHDTERLKIGDRLFFLGVTKSPDVYFAAADLFYLSSREDPYPLVCLEAAAVGVPILCFNEAGGMPEFVNPDAGIVVPYLNIGMAAEKIIFLKKNTDYLNRLSLVAKKRTMSSAIELIGPQIWDVIMNMSLKN